MILSPSSPQGSCFQNFQTFMNYTLLYCTILCFYCVSTSYPMDSCFTGWRDRSHQTPEKDVLYILLAGPVTECSFARWRIVVPSCLDIVTSYHLFCLARGVCRHVFYRETFLKFYTNSSILVTFNRSISQAMVRTMQDLSEGVFISVANFTLAHRDSYLE